MYSVKEIFYTLQGEGVYAGRAAVFLRFSGCNLWSGREQDRSAAVCNFCDTDFIGTDGAGGGKFNTGKALADAVNAAWAAPRPPRGLRPLVVCTGGEPLLQLDEEATAALHRHGFEIAVETNGTQPRPKGIDWLCVSPKGRSALVLTAGDELKLVYPQPEIDPASMAGLDFSHFRLQPLDSPELKANTEAAIRYCMENPQWQLGGQLHKFWDIE